MPSSIAAQVAASAVAGTAVAILVKAGAEAGAARIVVDALVESDLMGHASHGLRMLPLYVERLRSGAVDGRATPTIAVDHDAVVRVDANRCFGQVAGGFAASLGIDRARAHGIALVTIGNSGHFGRNGKWPEMAAASGVASLHFGKGRNGTPMLAPFGGLAPRLFSSPIALGVPGATAIDGPIILDFAVAETSINEVRRAAAIGVNLPAACIVTPDGRLSADPAVLLDATQSAAIACFGGFKGYGLAIFAEVFAGILAVDLPIEDRPENSLFSVYIDIARLVSAADYASAVAGLARSIRECPPIDPAAGVVMPGDRASERMNAADATVILHSEAVTAALAMATKLANMPLTRVS